MSAIGKNKRTRKWLGACALTVLVIAFGLVALDRASFVVTEPRIRTEYGTVRELHGSLWSWPDIELIDTQRYSTVGELVVYSRVCQTFIARHDGLSHVEVMLFDYGRKNTGPFLFHLRTTPDDSQDIFMLTQDASSVKDYVYHVFEFPPIEDSAGRAYCFCLEAPDAELLNSITALGTIEDTFPHGEAVFREMWGQSVGVRDLDFRLGYHLPMSIADKLAVLSRRLTEYKPFLCGDWWFYALLGVIYLVLLYFLFARMMFVMVTHQEVDDGD